MNPLIIHTKGSGHLADDTGPEEIRRIAREVAASEHAVLHAHGGLVPQQTARDMAARLDVYYRAGGIVPVFFVWETGLFETVRNNLPRIAEEKTFKALLKKLLRHVAGKVLLETPGSRSVGPTPLPSPVEVQTEYRKREVGEEPFGDRNYSEVNELTEEEEIRFKEQLEADPAVDEAVAGVLLGIGTHPPAGSRAPVGLVVPEQTLMSKSVTDRMKAEAEQPGGKGLIETATIVRGAVVVLKRVIKRFVERHDHGIHATIVEELLREFYIDAIGATVWGSMKNDARDNFAAENGTPTGGTSLLKELAAALAEREANNESLPKLSFVGHSAGTIFACELLRHVANHHPALTLHRLVFLAAACRCDLFSEILDRHEERPLWKDFRSYALLDTVERGYWEVPVVYPRSLLYLISGILETKDGKGADDMPLVGMERYLKWADIYTDPEVVKVAQHFTNTQDSQVWSVSAGAPGMSANAIRHGGFDETTGDNSSTMASVVAFLNH